MKIAGGGEIAEHAPALGDHGFGAAHLHRVAQRRVLRNSALTADSTEPVTDRRMRLGIAIPGALIPSVPY